MGVSTVCDFRPACRGITLGEPSSTAWYGQRGAPARIRIRVNPGYAASLRKFRYLARMRVIHGTSGPLVLSNRRAGPLALS